jgi:hypothetical protein
LSEENEDETEYDSELEDYRTSFAIAAGLVDDMDEEESFDHDTATFTAVNIGRNLDAISLRTEQRNAGLEPNAVALNLIASRNFA